MLRLQPFQYHLIYKLDFRYYIPLVNLAELNEEYYTK